MELRMKLGMTNDVHWHSKAVTCLNPHAAKLKARNRDSVVRDNLIVIPSGSAAHNALVSVV
jgi:hypothetical protein